MINKKSKQLRITRNKGELDINAFNFDKVKIPSMEVTLPTDREVMVKFGDDNQFPFFLLDIYAKCPTHQAIINNKSNYIGSIKNKNGDVIDVAVNPNDNFNDFIQKVKLSFLIFNYFAIEVIFNNYNQPIQYVFIEPQNIRTNQAKNKFWFNKNGWIRSGGDMIEYDRYYPGYNQDSKSKVFFYDGYFPAPNNVYPNTEYCSSFVSILTDIAIRDFNINNIKNHFSASTLMSFFGGESITREQKDEVKRNLKSQFSGENGNKMFINFLRDGSTPPDVQAITSGDWDKAYDLISKKVEKDIFIGAQFNAILLSAKDGSSLGNPQELKTAYEIFKANYIDQKRNELIGALKQLFTGSDFPTDIEFTDEPLFIELSESTKTQILTINELRKLAGFPPIDGGDRLINTTDNDNVYEKMKYMSINEIRNGKGLESLTGHDSINSSTEGENFSVVSDDGEPSQQELDTMFSDIEQMGVGVFASDFEVINENQFSFADDKTEYLTMYQYVKREEASGDTIIPTSRNFCRRIVDLNRYFSREDITKMSERMGFDVFVHCGGWWKRNKKSVNHCRHEWKQVRLKRKV